MSFLTSLALRRQSVTILAVVLVLAAGVFTYNQLERELFPEIEFPNIFILTLFPSANPETVEREVTEPIEEAIDGMQGLKEIQSTSSANLSLIQVAFEFGEDMKEAERTIQSSLSGIDFPVDVSDPQVTRLNNNTFPVLQLSVKGDRDIPSLQRLVDDLVIPQIDRIDGVFSVSVLGKVDERVTVTVDTDKLEDLGLSMAQVTAAIRSNNSSFPAGEIDQAGLTFPVRATHELGSLRDIREVPVGFETASTGLAGGSTQLQPTSLRGNRLVRLGDVATVELSTAKAASISRTNGQPSLSLVVIKEPDANTVDVTNQVLAALDGVEDLPEDVEVLVLQNDGPEVERQLSGLLREGLLGFFFAISAVFVFLINTRPTLLRGMRITLRPTTIIGVSIPLSILTGVLAMAAAGLSLNFMSLAGLAIAVGRVVDDSIVVLENMYRHMQLGEDRMTAAINGTREVGAAIVSSTLTTVVVFIPLAFIKGLVGEFFTPFAMSVSFALLGSTLVALTAVPVLGVLLLREGDFPDDARTGADRDTWLQRLYTPILSWALGHKAITVLGAVLIVGASLALLLVIPVTFFPAGTPQFITMDLEMETGTSVGRTFEQVARVEGVLEEFEEMGYVEVYQVTLGSSSEEFGPGASAGNLHIAGFFLRLSDTVPEDIAQRIRSHPDLGAQEEAGATLTVNEIAGGPPADALEITITGSNFTSISTAARDLEAALGEIEGIVNVNSDVSVARDEVTIRVDPLAAAEFGLTTKLVGLQVNQFIVGRTVTEVDLEGVTLDVVVRGRPEDANELDKLKNLNIQSQLGLVKLGSISDIAIEQGPLSISHFDLERSASIGGDIIAEDTQAVGREVAAAIAALDLPPGVSIETGGIFEQISEGFQDVFTAMFVGVILVYLVMVASLGSLRDPFIIVLSLPLAIVGALVALAVTDKTLSLSAMMGFLLLIGVVVTNAIVLITFVEQLRNRGMGVYDALMEGGRTRVRPILMTAFTTTFALLPLAFSSSNDGGIIGSELATVVIGGLVSSTSLTLVAVPVLYTLFHASIPSLGTAIANLPRGRGPAESRG